MAFLRKKGLFESNRVVFLPISSVAPNPAQPRTSFPQEDLEELAASIAQHGILQPLSVRRADMGGYELISGERRLRAAALAGLEEVPCIIVSADAVQSSLLALIENVQRRDLDFLEEAKALQALLQMTGETQEALAQRIGKSQSAVANKLRLLKLSERTLEILRDHGYTERHARALLRLEEPEQQEAAAEYIVQRQLTVAQTETYVEETLHPVLKRSQPIFLMKDVRLFLNTLTKNLKLIQSAGVPADCQRQDLEHEILLTIRIPR